MQYIFLLFKVVRLCAKSREAVSSPVEHLTLHYQVTLTFFFYPFSFHTMTISIVLFFLDDAFE